MNIQNRYSAGSEPPNLCKYEHVDQVETVESGGVLVFTGIDIQFLDALGNLVWRFDGILPFLENHSVGGNTLVVDETFEKTVYAINLQNGALIWRYDYGSSEYTEILRVDDNGNVYLSTNDGSLIFD